MKSVYELYTMSSLNQRVKYAIKYIKCTHTLLVEVKTQHMTHKLKLQ